MLILPKLTSYWAVNCSSQMPERFRWKPLNEEVTRSALYSRVNAHDTPAPSHKPPLILKKTHLHFGTVKPQTVIKSPKEEIPRDSPFGNIPLWINGEKSSSFPRRGLHPYGFIQREEAWRPLRFPNGCSLSVSPPGLPAKSGRPSSPTHPVADRLCSPHKTNTRRFFSCVTLIQACLWNAL